MYTIPLAEKTTHIAMLNEDEIAMVTDKRGVKMYNFKKYEITRSYTYYEECKNTLLVGDHLILASEKSLTSLDSKQYKSYFERCEHIGAMSALSREHFIIQAKSSGNLKIRNTSLQTIQKIDHQILYKTKLPDLRGHLVFCLENLLVMFNIRLGRVVHNCYWRVQDNTFAVVVDKTRVLLMPRLTNLVNGETNYYGILYNVKKNVVERELFRRVNDHVRPAITKNYLLVYTNNERIEVFNTKEMRLESVQSELPFRLKLDVSIY
jgi:hypothetical protein